jgi:DNA polymerase I-like protein with 3'-5' exonuclease and polymerase domains
MKYLIVTAAVLSKPMEFVLWRLLEQQNVMREECKLLVLLSAIPKGKGQKTTVGQSMIDGIALREALAKEECHALILMGGDVFRAVTGLKWKIDNVAGYILRPEDLVPGSIRKSVQIGTYATSNKARGYSKGDPKFGTRLSAEPVTLPRGCEIIVPSITIESVVKARYANVTQFRAAFINARDTAAGLPLDDDAFAFSDRITDVAYWSQPGVVAYDLEVVIGSTNIERASFSSSRETFSFPWDADGMRAMRQVLEGASLRVAHNQQFDIPILKAHGINVPEPTFDTMLAASLLEPNLPKGLIAVAPIYLRLRPWKHLSETRGFADPYYNAKDSFVERLLAIRLQERLKEDGMDGLFKVMMSAVPVLMDMSAQGMRVDPVETKKWCECLEDELMAATRAWVMKYPDVNPASPRQLAKLFYERWNCRALRRKGDGIRTDAYAIRVLSEDYPQHREDLALLLKIRETGKDLSTYGRTALGVDFVHPSYLPVGKDGTERGPDRRSGKGLAATGRLATSNPNIQNQPMEARRMYIPDQKDWSFVEFDWSQAELRIAAAIAGDHDMLEALDHDIHAHVMARLGLTGPYARTVTKNVVYGSAYGAGPYKIQETILEKAGIRIALKEVQAVQKGLAETFSAWWAWRIASASEAAARQYCVNPFGRVRHFPMGGADTPAILDFIPQSVVGDMAWELYRPVWECAQKYGGRLTTVIHDSFVIQAPAEKLGPLVHDVKALLERRFDNVAPGFYLPVEVKIAKLGLSWAEMEKL